MTLLDATIAFGPAVEPLLATDRLSDLGPGAPRTALRSQLAALTPETVVAPRRLVDREMALACCAGLWLKHDFLHESHEISQEIESSTGSYWHGIMHRREPDYANAKYWFRRVGNHPIFGDLMVAARRLVQVDADRGARGLVEADAWDPFAFVDLCQRAAKGPPELVELCQRLQAEEWRLLFAYCYLSAVGEGRG